MTVRQRHQTERDRSALCGNSFELVAATTTVVLSVHQDDTAIPREIGDRTACTECARRRPLASVRDTYTYIHVPYMPGERQSKRAARLRKTPVNRTSAALLVVQRDRTIRGGDGHVFIACFRADRRI